MKLRIEVPVEDMARLGEMEDIPSGPASQTPRRVSIWNAIHPRLRLTKPFYDWFTPAIAASDFALRSAAEGDLDKALDFIAVCRP